MGLLCGGKGGLKMEGGVEGRNGGVLGGFCGWKGVGVERGIVEGNLGS